MSTRTDIELDAVALAEAALRGDQEALTAIMNSADSRAVATMLAWMLATLAAAMGEPEAILAMFRIVFTQDSEDPAGN